MKLSPELEARLLATPGVLVNGCAPVAPQPIEETISEADFQLAVTDLADQNSWKRFHVNLPKKSKEGWPDLFLVKHRAVAMELKVGDNQPSAAQRAWLDAMNAAKVEARVFWPKDWPAIVAILTEKPK